jgi:hypothetical protein
MTLVLIGALMLTSVASAKPKVQVGVGKKGDEIRVEVKRCGDADCVQVRIGVASLGRNYVEVNIKTKLEFWINQHFSLYVTVTGDIDVRPPSIDSLKKQYMPSPEVVRKRVNEEIDRQLESIPVPTLLKMTAAERQKLVVDTTERVVREVTNDAIDKIAKTAGPEVRSKWNAFVGARFGRSFCGTSSPCVNVGVTAQLGTREVKASAKLGLCIGNKEDCITAAGGKSGRGTTVIPYVKGEYWNNQTVSGTELTVGVSGRVQINNNSSFNMDASCKDKAKVCMLEGKYVWNF